VLRLKVPPGGATSTVTIDDLGDYAVVFSNCQQVSVKMIMDVRTEMYNVRRPDGTMDYLPVGLQPLLAIYAGVSAV
jgi:hypothetical protein